MLEKSRVVKVSSAERSYHIFYELIAGSSPEEKILYNLEHITSYNYLKDACFEVVAVSDATEFNNLKLALSILNFNTAHIEALFMCISAILQIGNLTFDGDNAKILDDHPVGIIASLMDINKQELLNVLCGKNLVVRTDRTYIPFNPTQASDNKDVLAKTLYASIFQHLVAHINISLTTTKAASTFLGILDIFGFESFVENSFEQLCKKR